MEQRLREEHRSALSQVQSQLQQAQQVAADARREADTLKAQLESVNRRVLGLYEHLACQSACAVASTNMPARSWCQAWCTPPAQQQIGLLGGMNLHHVGECCCRQVSSSGADVDQWRSKFQQVDQARLAAEGARDAAQNSGASKDAQVAQLTQANVGLQQQLDSVKHQLQSSQAAAQQALNSQQTGRAEREQARAEPAPAGVLEL